MTLISCFLVLGLNALNLHSSAIAAPERVYEVVVTGMTCKGCAREVSDLLTKLDGVKSVEVDFKATKATITMKGEATLDRAAVDKALKGTKFGVTSMEEKKAPASRPGGSCSDR